MRHECAGIVRAVKRRPSIALLVVVVAALSAGCTTFSDNDAAARVGDVEFTHDELVAELEELGATTDQVAQADIARGQISAWVAEQVTAAADPALAADAYAQGLLASGSICLDILAVATQADADAAVTDLTDGTPFADLFASANIEPSLAESNGRIGCLPLTELALDAGNPLVDSITEVNAASPYATAFLPGDAAAGAADLYVVSRFIPFDELGPEDIAIVAGALPADALGLDIYVDPRLGTYDAATATVIPLA